MDSASETARRTVTDVAVGPRPASARRDGLIAAALAVLIGVVGGAMTEWGPCFGDPGELQTASAVAGIAHPPGYAGYLLLGRLICLLPLAEPATLISAANLLAGAMCVALIFLIQRRMSVHPLAAVITTLIVVLHDRFWMVLTVPEVYAPSLLLLCLAVYAGLRWAQGASRGWLFAGAAACGLLVIDRPPDLLMMPALFLFVIVAGWQRFENRRALGRFLRGLVLTALVPVLIGIGYVLVRDTPATPYNYVEDYHRTFKPIGSGDGGVLDRGQRLVWLLSAEQYRDSVATALRRVKVRTQYLWDEFGWMGLSAHEEWYRGPAGFCLGLGVVLLGTIRLLRTHPATGVMTLLLILGNAAFYCLYVAYGSEAYILPALVFVGCLAGAGLTRILYLLRLRPGPVAAVLLVIGAGVYLSSDDDWLQTEGDIGAGAFLAAADVRSLPPDAVILGIYDRVTPLQYDVLVRTKRPDIKVLAVAREYFEREVPKWDNRPLYLVRPQLIGPEYELVPERNLQRVVPAAAVAHAKRTGGTDP